MRQLALLVVLAVLALPAAARAQDQGGDAFGPLPPAPTPAPTTVVVQDSGDDSSDVGRTTLYVIAGGLLVAFVLIGRFIARDARRHLPEGARTEAADLREQGPHRHAKHAKARARSRAKAQRAARRRNR